MKIPLRFAVFVVLLQILAGLCGCSEVLITKRRSLHLVPHSRIVALSSEYFARLVADAVLSTDEHKIQMVERVGRKIVEAATALLVETGRDDQIRNYSWAFSIVENDKKVNAFGLPDGRVVLYSGIFDYARDDGEVAVVLGHEVGHIIAGHSNERMSYSVATGNEGQKGPGFKKLVALQEAEADRIGLLLMAKAGFDPLLAIDFWKRFSKKRSGPRSAPSLHPDPAARIAGLQNCLFEALLYYQPSEN